MIDSCGTVHYRPIIRLDDSGRYLHMLDWKVNTKERPDKPGPSRRNFGQAVDRSLTVLC